MKTEGFFVSFRNVFYSVEVNENLEKQFNSLIQAAGGAAIVSDPKFWIELGLSIDESIFPMKDWVEAWVFIEKWLISNKLSVAHDDRREYLACAAEGAATFKTAIPGMFLMCVSEYLETRGMEKAK